MAAQSTILLASAMRGPVVIVAADTPATGPISEPRMRTRALPSTHHATALSRDTLDDSTGSRCCEQTHRSRAAMRVRGEGPVDEGAAVDAQPPCTQARHCHPDES
uniref:Uncharacterized protein n=1 Tax=Janibacter limosus TaxID=53458 RepID=A0AC61U6A6_9MICO|nr:hypothetical protein [Janibacter limosus]